MAINTHAAVRDVLESSFQEVTKKNGMISFLKSMSDDPKFKYGIKRKDFDHIFSTQVWIKEDDGGHTKFKHRLIPGMVIEYSGHDKMLDPGAANSQKDRIQELVNVLGNEIFQFSKHNWKSVPDFDLAATRCINYLGL